MADYAGINAAVAALSNKFIISEPDRESGLKLIKNIIENTINNPFEIKYQRLLLTPLFEKLNHNDVWIQLLLNSGFIESDNGELLTFDIDQLDKLQYVKNILSTKWQQNESNNTNSQITNEINNTNGQITNEFESYKINLMNSVLCNYINFKLIGEKLQHIRENKQTLSDEQLSVLELINDGFSIEDAITAIELSLNLNNSPESIQTSLYSSNDDNAILSNGSIDPFSLILENKNMTANNCVDDYLKCDHIKRFTKKMNEYKSTGFSTDVNLDKIMISCILNDYIHLIYQHNDEKEFEYIVNKLEKCNMIKCIAFERNYRSRQGEFGRQCNTRDACSNEIIYKMHCYFSHCFDVGNRVTLKQKNEATSESKYEENNKQIQNLYTIISKNCNNNINNERYKRYNQITQTPTVKKNVQKEYEQHQMYHVGYVYDYIDIPIGGGLNDGLTFDDAPTDLFDPDDETDMCLLSSFSRRKTVHPRYSTLKNEIVYNKINPLSIGQFDVEYNKAELHISTSYCV